MISKAIVGEFARLPLLVSSTNSNINGYSNRVDNINGNRVDNDNGNIVLGQFSPSRSVSNNNNNNNNNDDSKATVLIK